jgi:hypothetical protein
MAADLSVDRALTLAKGVELPESRMTVARSGAMRLMLS